MKIMDGDVKISSIFGVLCQCFFYAVIIIIITVFYRVRCLITSIVLCSSHMQS